MTTHAMQARDALRRLVAFRLNASIFFLAGSYIGGEMFLRGGLSRLTMDMSLLVVAVVLLAPIVAMLFSLYQLVRYRSLQHLAEIAIAVWLFIRVAGPLARFTGAPYVH